MHTPAHHPLRGRGGFSMPEMLVVLVIMGIATAIIVPRLQGVAKVSSVQGALNRVAGDLSFARIRAIRNGARAQVVIASDGKSYTTTVNTTTPETRTTRLGKDFPATVLSPAGGTVTFDSRGMLVTGSTATITATNQGRSATVSVSGVGIVYRNY
ncbi:MAG TPA: GspH/FimT family pseudopilin [Longimicrobium sp.]|nr:GspH/FimT family pseudopilin [Longimicrobium sp.]